MAPDDDKEKGKVADKLRQTLEFYDTWMSEQDRYRSPDPRWMHSRALSERPPELFDGSPGRAAELGEVLAAERRELEEKRVESQREAVDEYLRIDKLRLEEGDGPHLPDVHPSPMVIQVVAPPRVP